MTQRQNHNWSGGRGSKRGQALREAVGRHIDARITEGLYAPRKRELAEMLAEAARNTAKMEVEEKSA
jgi:hypothetical protein